MVSCAPMRIVAGVLAGIVVLYAPCVEAQEPSIAVANGRVTMAARDVPLQHVVSELARLGGVTVSGADKIGAAPVTLELNDVDGRVAFEILLRNTGGYVLIARQDAAPGALPIARVFILPENVSGRSGQSGFPSQSDPEAAFQHTEGIQTGSGVASAVEAPASPVAVSPPQPTPTSPTPVGLTRPAPSTAVPTFAVPTGFSGRPGEFVPRPPGNPYGIDTTRIPTTGEVLGEKPK